MAAPVDDGHRLLPRYREGTIALERRNALIVLEAELAADQAGKPIGKPALRDPVDAVRLRGIPCVGPGTAGGAIRGTRPDVAVLRLDGRR
jgi:hypothetical protein